MSISNIAAIVVSVQSRLYGIMILMLAAALRLLGANGCRHGRSEMMWLLRRSTAVWNVFLAMTRHLLLEAHHIGDVIIVHVLR